MRQCYTLLLATILLTCFQAAHGQSGLGSVSGFMYSSTLHCHQGPNLLPTSVSSAMQYPFQEVTGNVVFVDNLTGEIDMTASTPGTWTIKRVAPTDSTFRTVIITPRDVAAFSYVPDSVCTGSADTVLPVISGTGGGSFDCITSGLALNPLSGMVLVSLSLPGTYAIDYYTAGACPDTGSATLAIVQTPDPYFDFYPSQVCNQGMLPPDTMSSPGLGIFSTTPLGGLSMDPQSGVINLDSTDFSSGNTFWIDYSIAGACPATFRDSLVVYVTCTVPAFTYPDSVFCTNGAPVSVTNYCLWGQNHFSSIPTGLMIDQGNGTIDPTGSQPGTYSVNGGSGYPCAGSRTVTITIVDTFQLSLLQVGNTAVAPTAGSNFTWFVNGNAVPGATDSALTINTTGNYEVEYTDAARGCPVRATAVLTRQADPSAQALGVRLYPQPSTGMVQFALTGSASTAVTWSLHDQLGRSLAMGTSASSSGTMDLTALPQGHYHLRLQTRNAAAVVPLIIER